MKYNDVLLSKYSYGGKLFDQDTWSGLTIAIHGWTASEVKVLSYNQNGSDYSGTLQFTFVDHFGLDEEDINMINKGSDGKYSFNANSLVPQFKAWYILQHYEGYNQKYKPFKTVVTINHNFSGSLD